MDGKVLRSLTCPDFLSLSGEMKNRSSELFGKTDRE